MTKKEDMMNFILATTNQGKAVEIKALFGADCTIQTLTDIGFTDEIIESGKTFKENAIIKAKAIHGWINQKGVKGTGPLAGPGAEPHGLILADDSGLIIDALDGKPGVYSARWLGVETPYDVKNRKTLEILINIPEEKRTARFVSVVACAWPDGRIETVEGILEGLIAFKPAGEDGFGYDPIFFVPEEGRTLAQLSREEKNRISHRGQALRKMARLLGVNLN